MRLIGRNENGSCNACGLRGYVHEYDENLPRSNEDGSVKRENDDPNGQIMKGRRACPKHAWGKMSAEKARARGADPRGKRNQNSGNARRQRRNGNRDRRNENRGGVKGGICMW